MTYTYEFRDFGKIKNILYVGDDSNYWGQIKNNYEKHFSQVNCLFYLYRVEGDITHKDVFLKILQLRPSVIYLDFTKRHNEMFQLARLISRDGIFFGTSIVGFVNHVEEVDEVMKNGCSFAYVKCGEFYDAVYGPLRYCLPNKIPTPNFAKGMLDENRDLFIPVRVGYIHPSKIHFEGNFTPIENNDYEIETAIERNYLPSKGFKCLKLETFSGKYYNYCNAFSMTYHYVNKPSLLSDFEKAKSLNQKFDISPQVINATIQEYNSDRQQVRKNFSNWIYDNLNEGREKLTKVLIIDPNYDVLIQHDGDLSDSDYAFRMQSDIEYTKVYFEKFRPDLIVFSLMNEPSIEEARKIIFEHRKKKGTANKYNNKSHYSDVDKDPLDKEDTDELDIEISENEDEEELKKVLIEKIINDQLIKLFSNIENCKEYNPSILIFNSRNTSEEIISKFGEHKLVATKNKFEFSLVLKMAKLVETNQRKKHLFDMQKKLDILKQEQHEKYKGVRVEDIVEPKFFIPKLNKISTARLKVAVSLIAISESEIWFKSKQKFYFGVYELDIPTKIRFTIAPDAETYENFTADKDGDIYHGLIHSFDENGKKLLRQDVNRIFFSDLIAQRELESKEYKDLTKDALGKKMEELEKLKRMMELNEVKKKI
jgi:hypothetical protein